MAQPTAQYTFGPANGGGDIIHFENAQNAIVSWIDSTGTGQGALAAGAIQRVTATLTSAQIKTLNSVPTQIIAAPGAGLWINVTGCALRWNFGGVAYVGSGTLELIFGNNPANHMAAQFSIAVTTALNAVELGTGPMETAGVAEAGGIPRTSVNNIGLFMACSTADPTAGNGTLSVTVIYTVEPVS